MAGKLIRHLQNKAKEHTHLELLNSQWNFDSELIPKALQTVGSIFTHYSRHDASHSRQILINIERLLGDTLEKLTATDTWMLLEAAYWHDIGMVVDNDSIAKDLQSEPFKQYVRDIASDKHHELQAFAQQFISLNPENCFSASETPQDAVSKYRQLLAEWYRRSHPERADVIVNDPWVSAGISSPRNELLPKRLFRVLGNICRMHGSSFEDVLTHLPFSEVGMATEDCHPRFVACLLRLGDLFDLDDNRFCPVMLRCAGKLPQLSQDHAKKHAAIRHFRLDPEYVELVAECDDYGAYEATDQWFGWIKNELRDQMLHWKEIVPSREFGLLPTLGRMEVNLANNQILNPGERPRFTLEQDKVIELLQGAGLYESSFDSIRELLQNAVDATLIRIWLMHGPDSDYLQDGLDWQRPDCEKVRALFDQYPLAVHLDKKDVEHSGEKTFWILKIIDKGIGISKTDLKYMASIGGSSKNKAKGAVVHKMPEWMKPSGVFGIGLQSAFLLSDSLKITSKSLFSGESIAVEMQSPIGKNGGLIYIKDIAMKTGADYGCCFEIGMHMNKIPQSVSSNDGNFIDKVLPKRFDPVVDAEYRYDAARIGSAIYKFSIYSPIKINFFMEGDKVFQADKTEISEMEYCEEKGILLRSPLFTDKKNLPSNLYYRGQKVERNSTGSLPFFYSQGVDILQSSASDLLTINRSEIKDSARNRLGQDIQDAVADFAKFCLASKTETEETKIYASAFLKVTGQIFEDKEFFWHKVAIKVHLDGEEKLRTIKDFIAENSLSILAYDRRYNEAIITSDRDRPHGYVVPEVYEQRNRLYLLAVAFIEAHHAVHIEDVTIGKDLEEIKALRYTFEKGKTGLTISKSFLRRALVGKVKGDIIFSGRVFAFPFHGYTDLTLDKNTSLSWPQTLEAGSGVMAEPYRAENRSWIILPFFFDKKGVTLEELDSLCVWVKKNIANKSISLETIKQKYDEMIKWIDNDVMGGIVEWRNARGLPLLDVKPIPDSLPVQEETIVKPARSSRQKSPRKKAGSAEK